MSSWSWKTGLASAAILAATAYAVAQMPTGHDGMHAQMGSGAQGHGPMHKRMMQMMHGGMRHGMGQQSGMSGQPTMPGQEAFGTIQEVVQILEADPTTDWSKVNIAALREHLIDMNEVTLRAVATEQALENGVEIAVTGEGRTLEAIRRMVPAHVGELVKIGWIAKTEDLPNGVKLSVTTNDSKQVTKLKALGFMGIMVQGGHHQPHHLMMAKGDFHMH
jgi:predicted RNA binding protein YcfA (HicA-like mRNA interferase family)